MNRAALFAHIIAKKSYLCVGLDTDPRLLPAHLRSETDPVFAFNQQIIDATADLCVAYKPNVAFYEAQGPRGWESLQRTMEYVPTGHLAIADAKRGDIGNTADLYARAFFDPTAAGLRFDALTVAPYMGRDSVTPFLTYPGKWVVLLALTSNAGSADFQQRPGAQGEPLFETVLRVSQTWTGAEDPADRLMYVVGATHPEAFARVRALAPDHFLLVPGVGAQGGSLADVSRAGLNRQGGLLVNAARTILYADRGRDFAAAARREAQRMQREMEICLDECL